MKKTLTSFIALTMAVLVLYGGAGINIISYCCGDCRSAGVEALIHQKCCEIHQHSHKDHTAHNKETDCKVNHQAENATCSHTTHANRHDCEKHHDHTCDACTEHSSGNCCSMERIDFDWSVQDTAEKETDLSPIGFDLLSDDLFVYTHTHLSFVSETNTTRPNGPPLVCPREYLSRLTVLLI